MDWITQLNLHGNLLTNKTVQKDMLPKNLTHLNLSSNRLTEINTSMIPASVVDLEVNNNSIVKIVPLAINNLTNFSARNNLITDVSVLPSKLIEFDLYGNKMMILPDFPLSVRTANVAFNSVVQIGPNTFNNGLVELDISQNSIEDLVHLPHSLEVLIINDNRVKVVDELPKNLIRLVAFSNMIEEFSNKLPDKLEELDVQGNRLTVMPRLPSDIERVVLKSNSLCNIVFEDIPENTLYLDISMNMIKEIPSSIRNRPFFELICDSMVNDLPSDDSDTDPNYHYSTTHVNKQIDTEHISSWQNSCDDVLKSSPPSPSPPTRYSMWDDPYCISVASTGEIEV